MRPNVGNVGGRKAAPSRGYTAAAVTLITRCSFFLIIISASLIALVIGMVTWMVFARTFGIPSHGLLELSVDCMVMSVFLAAPYTLHKNGHVGLDIVTEALPDKISKYIIFVADLLGLFVCVYLSWLGMQLAADAIISGEKSLGPLRQYVWPKYAAMGLGMGMTAIQYCAYITDRLMQRSKK